MAFGKATPFITVQNKNKVQRNKLFYRFVFVFNILCIIFLLCSDLAPILNPVVYWPIALTGLLFPFLFITVCIFSIFWLFIKPKRTYVSILAILISIPNLISTFAFHYPTPFHQSTDKNNIRIVSWNVALMSYTELDTMVAIKKNAIIFKKLSESNADVICLQEFFTSVIAGNHYNLMDSISRKLNYPYYYFSRDDPKFDKKFYNGSIIFSRYKIIDSQKIIFPGAFAGSIIRTGIVFNKDTIDIFNTRLHSVRFMSNEYKALHDIKTVSGKGMESGKHIIQKLRVGYANRISEINIVNKFVSETERPSILTADLNDVPVSYTHSKIKQNMSDSWIAKGFGIGKTFVYISPTLRLDHIFFNQYFKASQVKKIVTSGESDHHGIISDLYLIKKEQ